MCVCVCVCVCVHACVHVCVCVCVCACVSTAARVLYACIASLAEILDLIVLNPKLKKQKPCLDSLCPLCVCVCYPDCNSNLRGFLFMGVGTVSGAPGGVVRSVSFSSHIINPSHYGI